MDTTDPARSLHACLEKLRRLDRDRFLTTLFAPSGKRGALIALYAFNIEIARVREAVTEPMLGQIRLQWWREAIEGLAGGETRGHEAAIALAATWKAGSFPADRFISLIDARERDLDEMPFEDIAALEAYAEATSSALMTLAGFALVGNAVEEAGAAIRPAGIAYALTGLLRALPLHASQGRLFLPLDLMRRHEVDPHRIFAGEMSAGLRAAIDEILALACARLSEARASGRTVSRELLPALLPASLCDRYLATMSARDFDPFRHTTEVPAFLQQSRLAMRSLTRRF